MEIIEAVVVNKIFSEKHFVCNVHIPTFAPRLKKSGEFIERVRR